jgi:hypothetical protein
MTEELRETALHEAGHAVAAIVLGRSVEEVTVVPSRGFLGHCRHTPVFSPSDSGTFGPGDRERIEEEVIITLAGPAVAREKPTLPKGMPRPGRHDDWARAYRLTDALAQSFCRPYSRQQTRQYLLWLYARAKALVTFEPHLNTIRSVARALLAKRTMGHEETSAAYRAGLEEWDHDAADRIHELNRGFGLHEQIPAQSLSRSQIIELFDLADRLDAIEREVSLSGLGWTEGLLEKRGRAQRALRRYLHDWRQEERCRRLQPTPEQTIAALQRRVAELEQNGP